MQSTDGFWFQTEMGSMWTNVNQHQLGKVGREAMAGIIDKMMRDSDTSGLIIDGKYSLTYYRSLIDKKVELTIAEKTVLLTWFLFYADAEGEA